jgi:hypothetical protein
MNKTEHMLAILEARTKGRAIRARVTHTADGALLDTPGTWYNLAKDDMFLDFQRREYQIAPVDKECWLVYDHDNDEYIESVFDSGSAAAEWIINSLTGCPDPTGGRYEPVHVVPVRT